MDSMFSLYPEEERKITETARARGLDHGDHTLLHTIPYRARFEYSFFYQQKFRFTRADVFLKQRDCFFKKADIFFMNDP